jgi:hypothetical protein
MKKLDILIMKKILFFLLLVTVRVGLIAQNHQTVVSTNTTTFIGNQVESIRIDSSFVDMGDSIFYPFYNIQQVDYDCFMPFFYSWIGKKIIIKPNGYNYFINRNNDTIKINTLAQLNENWIASEVSDTIIIAEVVKHDTLSFLGQTDSAKTISFTMYDQNMNSISHPVNNMTTIISENFGFLKTINFSLFPEKTLFNQNLQTYNLLGMSSPPIGLVNLTWREIYDFEIGDEIHIVESNYQADWSVVTSQNYSKSIYLDKITYTDSVIYKVDREGYSYYIVNGQTRDKHYFHDTITVVYKSDFILDKLSGEIFDAKEYFVNMMEVDLSDVRIEIGYITKKTLPFYFKKWGDTCLIFDNNYLHLEPYCFLDGLGGPYYGWSYFEQGETRQLQYYEKGDKTWGTPFNFTEILEYKKDISFKIYPNPAHTTFQIKGIDDFQNYSVSIYNMYGQLVMQKQTLNREDIIYIEALPAGVYMVNIGIKDNIIINCKLIKL